MLVKNKFFLLSAIFTIFQQLFLAISTYFIAMAGESLVSVQILKVERFITLFFISALLAYFLSSCVEWLQVKLKNSLWERYIFDSFETIKLDQRLSSKKNQQLTTSWLTGEAPTTFEDISSFSVGLLSIYCNVVFTLIVFGLTLGLTMTGVLAISIVVSVGLVTMLKERIMQLASNIQSSKLLTFIKLNILWDNYLFGNKILTKLAHDNLQAKTKIYFAHSEKYVVTEQALACLPIYIAVPLVIMMMFLTDHTDASIGAFVAVLPRSLQLLGNVHSLSVYNSRFVLMKQKLNNLKCFVQKLERQDLKKQIETGIIQIFDVHAGSNLSVQQFLDQMHKKELKKGRFLITGANGVGKSSLLRFIKSINTEAILVSPDANLVNDDVVASSGERQVRQIDFVFSQDTAIFLLDEWDANLDFLNVLKVEDKINLMAKKALIIEVRHKIIPS